MLGHCSPVARTGSLGHLVRIVRDFAWVNPVHSAHFAVDYKVPGLLGSVSDWSLLGSGLSPDFPGSRLGVARSERWEPPGTELLCQEQAHHRANRPWQEVSDSTGLEGLQGEIFSSEETLGNIDHVAGFKIFFFVDPFFILDLIDIDMYDLFRSVREFPDDFDRTR